jgi:hypothetical protein
MTAHAQCEWCIERATYRIAVDGRDYTRYACNLGAHRNKTDRLVYLDNWPRYQATLERNPDGFPTEAQP